MSAVLFDLDGTLIDSVPDLHLTANALLAAHDRAPIDEEQARMAIGHGARALIRQVWSETGTPASEAELDRLYHQFLVLYRPLATVNTRPYPGVLATLDRLADRPLAIVTNKPEAPARAILDHLGLTARFGAILGGDSLPTRKPEPGMLHEALRQLGAPTGVVVGDSEVDVAAARSAGLPVIGVSWGYARGALDADAVIDRFDALPAALDALSGP